MIMLKAGRRLAALIVLWLLITGCGAAEYESQMQTTERQLRSAATADSNEEESVSDEDGEPNPEEEDG